MASFDGVIVGGGHNSLTLGAYLAKAGLRIAVVERNPEIGGGCTTEEVTLPKFRHNLHSNFYIGIEDAPIHRDLELHRYGFRHVLPPVQHAAVFRDGTAAVIHRDPQKTYNSFARFSKKDADTFRTLHDRYAVRMRGLINSLLYSLPLSPAELRERIKGEEGSEFLGYAGLSMNEAVDQHFEEERIRVLFKLHQHAITVEDLPGTGLFFPLVLSNCTRLSLPVGGSLAFPLALGRVIEGHGGALLRGKHVRRIVVQDGEARGVEVEDGSIIEAARFVASGIDAPQTMRLAGEEHFPREVVEKLRNWNWGCYSLATLHLALDEAPRYASERFGPDVGKAYNLFVGAEDSGEIQQILKEVEEGRFPSKPMGNGACNTLFDPGYAPEGKHIAFWWPFAPYNFKEGGPEAWDGRRKELTERSLEAWRRYAPNLTNKNVQGTYLFTPLDIARRNINMVEGSPRVGAYHPDQLGINRPHPELAHFRTPVKGLYLCGSSNHGGGVNGGPGYNAANVVAEDLGIQRWWTPMAPPDWRG
ncbi:MAG: NAD(P)/FAD-dependent oxidoreductase [Nitrospinota bacterium]|jgi:phytoene dehydrogenase-like protein|nr:NAD(P)/FAD-dependent oxidoreductase [Nitrospinota bacterium]